MKSFCVVRLTFKKFLQKERCVFSMHGTSAKPHTSEAYDKTGITDLSKSYSRCLTLMYVNLYTYLFNANIALRACPDRALCAIYDPIR